MIVKYFPNEMDSPIIDNIRARIHDCLEEWYGRESALAKNVPDIRSYKNSFILCYPLTTGTGANKNILVKIRRKPNMQTLSEAIHADIHGNIPTEFHSLQSVYAALTTKQRSFVAIRPLLYMEDYHAIFMEEFPSRTLRQLLMDQRSSRNRAKLDTLRDAAKKTGRWLHYFHQTIHRPVEARYSTHDVLYEIQSYAMRLEDFTRGRIRAESIVDAFSKPLEGFTLNSMKVSQSHADMSCDNVLYSNDQKVCIIDIKTRPAPIYRDLGAILIHPETFKSQIFSGGRYLHGSILHEYRSALLSGYLKEEPLNPFLVHLFSAIGLLDKWTMYEELISRYKGWKHLFSFAAGPMVSAYFSAALSRHLLALERTDTSLENVFA